MLLAFPLPARDDLEQDSLFNIKFYLRSGSMRPGTDFWTALGAFAIHVEHCAATEGDRRRQIMAAYTSFGPLGKKTVASELRLVLSELSAVEQLVAAAESKG
jgi:hypothetical protein